jgi:hypothetical protein
MSLPTDEQLERALPPVRDSYTLNEIKSACEAIELSDSEFDSLKIVLRFVARDRQEPPPSTEPGAQEAKQVREDYLARLNKLDRDELMKRLGFVVGRAVREVMDEEVGQQTAPSPAPQADEKAVAEKLVARLEQMARRVRILSNRPGREGDLLTLRTINDCIAVLRGGEAPGVPAVLMPLLPTPAYKKGGLNIDPDNGKHVQVSVSYFTMAQVRQYAAECVEAAVSEAVFEGFASGPVEPDFGDQAGQ